MQPQPCPTTKSGRKKASNGLGVKIKETTQAERFWEVLEADGDAVLDDSPQQDDWSIAYYELQPSVLAPPNPSQKGKTSHDPLLDEDEHERIEQYNRLLQARKAAWNQECHDRHKAYADVAKKPFRSLKRMPEPGLTLVVQRTEEECDAGEQS